MHKHAASAHVGLRLSFEPQAVRLGIHDDGRGFDAEQVGQHPSRGIGLRNMRERIEALGGRLSVRSQPGLTRITAELPNRVIRRLLAAA